MKDTYNTIVLHIRNNLVPIIFAILCLGSIVIAGKPTSFIVMETISRLSRNLVLVFSLILPILSGLGLNFSIVLGAMAGEIGMILITHWNIDGILGIGVAAAIGTLIAIIFGLLTGIIFNKVKGHEMITGMILGFFAVGVYDLFFLYLVGSVIPMKNPEIMLSQQNAAGETIYVGLRNTINFHEGTKYAIDNVLKMPFIELLPWIIIGCLLICILFVANKIIRKKQSVIDAIMDTKRFILLTISFIILHVLIQNNKDFHKAVVILQIPVFTFFIIYMVSLMITFILKTKLGRDLKTVGNDLHVANSAGINVNRTRIIVVILSTIIASWGQIISLQNIGNVQTFNSHEQVGIYAVAALLVGGASIDKASVGQIFIGTLLFHVMFFTTPLSGAVLFNDPQLGEYFRVFLCYGIISISLLLYAWKKDAKEKNRIKVEAEHN